MLILFFVFIMIVIAVNRKGTFEFWHVFIVAMLAFVSGACLSFPLGYTTKAVHLHFAGRDGMATCESLDSGVPLVKTSSTRTRSFYRVKIDQHEFVTHKPRIGPSGGPHPVVYLPSDPETFLVGHKSRGFWHVWFENAGWLAHLFGIVNLFMGTLMGLLALLMAWDNSPDVPAPKQQPAPGADPPKQAPTRTPTDGSS